MSRTAFTNATVVDGSGAPAQKGATILVNGRTVETVETGLDAVPEGYEELDLGGRTVVPGLIDAHIHVGYYRAEPDRQRYERFGEPKVTLLAAKQVREALLGGVTTLRDLGASHGQSITVRDAVAAYDELPGARVVAAGQSITFTGGHAFYEADGVWGLRKAVREQVRAGADVIKIGQSNDVTFPGFTPEELEAVIDEAHRLGRRVAVHVDREPGYGMAVRAGVDTVEHGFYPFDETLELMAEKGTYWVPTITINRGMRYDEYTAETYEENLFNVFKKNGQSPEHARKAARDMREAFEALPKCFEKGLELGVKIVASSDGPRAERIPMDAVRNEVVKFVEWGMSPVESIRAATGLAAEALELDSDLGLLREGYLADLVVLDEDPLEDIENIDTVCLVMKEGTVYRNDLN